MSSVNGQEKLAVLLLAYGGPDTLEDVEPYLRDVRGGRETPRELIDEITERYAKIGGKSPLLQISQEQAAALEKELSKNREGIKTYVGMRHWKPFIPDVVEQIYRDGFRQVIALCLTPYYSQMSVGAYRQKLEAGVERVKAQFGPEIDFSIRLIESWHDHPQYIRALGEQVRKGLQSFPAERQSSVVTLFTAHSLPSAIMQQGDPYDAQHQQTSALAAETAGLPAGRWQVGYQSAPYQAKSRWLGPSLDEMIETLAKQGEREVLVAPIGFVSDHVEILFDIDIETREEAEELGIHLERTESVNATHSFIRALAEIVEAERVRE